MAKCDAMSHAIEVLNLKNTYQDRVIHQDLNFSVSYGEVCGLIGPSGAGKSTLLRTLLGLHPAESGHVVLLNQAVHAQQMHSFDAIRSQVGVMFQHNALISSLTILENIMLPLQTFSDMSKVLCQEIALHRLKEVGLESWVSKLYPSELSGGMAKRAALARAIAFAPKLLFLDEPTAGLDPHSACLFEVLLKTLKQKLNLTVVMITHDLDCLFQCTDQVAFLAQRQVLHKAPIASLVQHPHPSIAEYFQNDRSQWRMQHTQEHVN